MKKGETPRHKMWTEVKTSSPPSSIQLLYTESAEKSNIASLSPLNTSLPLSLQLSHPPPMSLSHTQYQAHIMDLKLVKSLLIKKKARSQLHFLSTMLSPNMAGRLLPPIIPPGFHLAIFARVFSKSFSNFSSSKFSSFAP